MVRIVVFAFSHFHIFASYTCPITHLQRVVDSTKYVMHRWRCSLMSSSVIKSTTTCVISSRSIIGAWNTPAVTSSLVPAGQVALMPCRVLAGVHQVRRWVQQCRLHIGLVVEVRRLLLLVSADPARRRPVPGLRPRIAGRIRGCRGRHQVELSSTAVTRPRYHTGTGDSRERRR